MKHKPQTRNGITLVELLVVITIMMILAAVVLPQLDFGNERHKNRESARIVATYLSAARNKAIETGRPCGVLFERINGVQGSVQMVQVQVPPAYAGDTMNAQVTITGGNTATFPNSIATLIQENDLIQFDYQGPWYIISKVTQNDTNPQMIDSVEFTAPVGAPQRPLPNLTAFQISRQPVSTAATGQTIRSMTPPQRLLAGTAVDFTASGIGSNFFGNGTGNVSVMFDSNGAVQSITGLTGINTPIEPIYLLVGQETQIPDGGSVSWYEDPNIEENDKRPNWQNPECRWVVINPNTGVVTVAENMPYDVYDAAKTARTDMENIVVTEARKIAKEGLGGGDR